MRTATLRKNGVKMLTFTVEFNISREDMIAVVGRHLYNQKPPPKSRRSTIQLAKRAAHENGYWLLVERTTDEDIGDDAEMINAADKAATLIVDKLFPDFGGPK